MGVINCDLAARVSSELSKSRIEMGLLNLEWLAVVVVFADRRDPCLANRASIGGRLVAGVFAEPENRALRVQPESPTALDIRHIKHIGPQRVAIRQPDYNSSLDLSDVCQSGLENRLLISNSLGKLLWRSNDSIWEYHVAKAIENQAIGQCPAVALITL